MTNLMKGDCIELLNAIPDNSIDLVITDPPYVLQTKKHGSNDELGQRSFYREIESMCNGFSEVVLDELCRVMKKINIYIFCSQAQLMPLIDYFVTKKGCNFNLLTWHKTNPVPTCNNKYLNDTEYILFFREKGVKIGGAYATKKTYFISPTNVKDKKLYNHPTCKPIELITNFIINSSNEGDIILDRFMGSGTTGAAAVTNNRDFIGMELNEEYFNTAAERIEKASAAM